MFKLAQEQAPPRSTCIRKVKLLSVVVPAFNESTNVVLLARELRLVLNERVDFEVIFVDDGSVDDTLSHLKGLTTADNRFKYLSLSRNFGHQYALKAGLDHAYGDCVVTLDADLQHPPALIAEMLNLWEQGFDVVYTVRKEARDLSWIKRAMSNSFYGLVNLIADTNIKAGAADFRLLDAKVVRIIRQTAEESLFLRGLIPSLGFKSIELYYSQGRRAGGSSKYSFSKLISLALAGITATSIKPLRLSGIIGAVISIASILYGAYALAWKVFAGTEVTGWTSLAILVSLLGSLQLFMLGVIGEYLGKVVSATRRSPLYSISESSLTGLPENPQ